jgi:vancomycin resistance protein YoaR
MDTTKNPNGIDYSAKASDAKVVARDILRSQAAVRIQQRASDAADSVVSAVRRYAVAFADSLESKVVKAEKVAKILARRDSFAQGLGNVPGVAPEDLTAVTEAMAKLYAETDKKLADSDTESEKGLAEFLADAAKDIVDAKAEVAKAAENLTKLNNGEILVDKDDLLDLTYQLLEKDTI